MAELLVVAIDAAHDDPEKDRRGCYKRGDVVVTEDDGYEWGRKEGPPKFVVLHVQDTDKAVVAPLAEMQYDDDAGQPVTDTEGLPAVFRRRRWRVDLDALPPGIITALQASGRASLPPGQLRARVRRKRDGFQFPRL